VVRSGSASSAPRIGADHKISICPPSLANMRVEELSTTQVNASQVENGVRSLDESSVKVEKSFVEELEKELEQKYL
jgi:hypothetical protein